MIGRLLSWLVALVTWCVLEVCVLVSACVWLTERQVPSVGREDLTVLRRVLVSVTVAMWFVESVLSRVAVLRWRRLGVST